MTSLRLGTSLGLSLFLAAPLASQVPSPPRQIAGAVSAAPEGLRAGATVLGYANYHRLVTLRQGDNEMICLADDPSEAEFHVACYHRDLEPFMARGRELRAQGKRHAEVDSIRLADVRSGSLPMPNHPAALYSLTGSADSVDSAGVPHGAAALYVVYIPYATPETTGLTTNPSSKEPWLMAPGKPWAHIMIVP